MRVAGGERATRRPLRIQQINERTGIHGAVLCVHSIIPLDTLHVPHVARQWGSLFGPAGNRCCCRRLRCKGSFGFTVQYQGVESDRRTREVEERHEERSGLTLKLRSPSAKDGLQILTPTDN